MEDLGPALNTWFPSDPILEQVNLVFNYVQIIIQWFNDEIPSAFSGKCYLQLHISARFGHASVEVRMAVS